MYGLYYLCVCTHVYAGPRTHVEVRGAFCAVSAVVPPLHGFWGWKSAGHRLREQAPLLAERLHCPVFLLCFVFWDKIWCYSPSGPHPLCYSYSSPSCVLALQVWVSTVPRRETTIVNDIYSFFKKASPQFVEIPKIGLKRGDLGQGACCKDWDLGLSSGVYMVKKKTDSKSLSSDLYMAWWTTYTQTHTKYKWSFLSSLWLILVLHEDSIYQNIFKFLFFFFWLPQHFVQMSDSSLEHITKLSFPCPPALCWDSVSYLHAVLLSATFTLVLLSPADGTCLFSSWSKSMWAL